jgi:23S rRNA pseudouridine1911/1915/1917 synthase
MKTYFVQQTSSTMDLARQVIADKGLGEVFAVMCRTQTAGRGRGGSRWSQAGEQTLESSPAADSGFLDESADLSGSVRKGGLFGPCSFVIPSGRLGIPLNWLSLAVGCAVVDALWRARSRIANRLEFSRLLSTEPSAEMRLKWPNDVWAWPVDGAARTSAAAPKKLAGILCETSFRADQLQFVCIGLGMNVFEPPFEVSHAGSIVETWGLKLSEMTPSMRQSLSEIIATEVERELLDYLLTERTAEQLLNLTLERSLPLGTLLSVNKGEQTGAFAGLSPDGGLLLKGYSEPVLAADVSFPTPSARICLDFGNSQIHWRTENGERVFSGQTDWSKYDKKTLADDRLFARSELVQDLLKSIGGASRIELVWAAVASAAHSTKIIENLESLLVSSQASGREVLLSPVNADDVLRSAGLDADYASGQMGVDRALHAWMAAKMAQDIQEPVAVISVGTALTGVVVTPESKIAESFILPGPAMSLQSLNEKTARLPRVLLPASLPLLNEGAPYSTPLSMLRGLALQFCGLAELMKRHHRVGRIILTGGGAAACAENLHPEVKDILSVDSSFVLDAMSQFASISKNSRFNMMQADEGSPDGLPEKVLQSMLRARISRRRVQRVTLDRSFFRRLGGRLEHVGVGLRLDRHLGEKFKFHTRDIWQQRVDIGEILIEQNSPKNHLSDAAPANLISVKSTYVLKHGDQIWLFHPPEYEPDMMTNIDVVYDDGDAAVFCKPGNLVVHAAGLYGKNTFIEIAKKMGYANAAPVHRIDRETSGILVCARSTPLRRELSLSFRDSSVKKMYLAVTKGTRMLPSEFRVGLPIGPAVNSRIRLKLWHNPTEGLDALTHCVRLAAWEDYSLFACMPQTGRTNQIRVHLAAIGHWIVGDKMYHPDEEAFLQFYEEGYIPSVAEKVLLPRHWLHNTGIQFLSKPESDLGRSPVIAPLTEDLLIHPPTLELLRCAGLPSDFNSQKKAFEELFQRILEIDFSVTPFIEPQAGGHG